MNAKVSATTLDVRDKCYIEKILLVLKAHIKKKPSG